MRNRVVLAVLAFAVFTAWFGTRWYAQRRHAPTEIVMERKDRNE